MQLCRCLGTDEPAGWEEMLSVRRYEHWSCNNCRNSLILRANFCSADWPVPRMRWSKAKQSEAKWSEVQNPNYHPWVWTNDCYRTTNVSPKRAGSTTEGSEVRGVQHCPQKTQSPGVSLSSSLPCYQQLTRGQVMTLKCHALLFVSHWHNTTNTWVN